MPIRVAKRTRLLLGALLLAILAAGLLVIAEFPVAAQQTIPLTITKSDSPDPVFVGGTLTYTITVTNRDDEEAEGVVVRDPLPTGVTFTNAIPPRAGVATIQARGPSPATSVSSTKGARLR